MSSRNRYRGLRKYDLWSAVSYLYVRGNSNEGGLDKKVTIKRKSNLLDVLSLLGSCVDLLAKLIDIQLSTRV